MATDLGPRGRQLWKSLLAHDDTLADSDTPMREVALAACQAVDRVVQLEELARTVDLLTDGGSKMHPVFAEVRQQEAAFARLVTALRLPDEATGKRPQVRSARGVQKPSAVSSLERARAAKRA